MLRSRIKAGKLDGTNRLNFTANFTVNYAHVWVVLILTAFLDSGIAGSIEFAAKFDCGKFWQSSEIGLR